MFFWCLTRLYVVVVCDGCIIMDGILGIQNRIFWCLSVAEGTDVVVNLIAEDVWDSEDELTGALSWEVESWDWVCLLICPLCFSMMNSKTNNIKW